VQRAKHRHREEESGEPYLGDLVAGDGPGAIRVRRGDHPGVGLVEVVQHPLDSDGQRVQDEQGELGAGPAEPAEQENVNRVAEGEHGRNEHEDRKERVDSEIREQRVAEIRAQNHEDRLGEVDGPRYPEDDCLPAGDQRVNPPNRIPTMVACMNRCTAHPTQAGLAIGLVRA